VLDEKLRTEITNAVTNRDQPETVRLTIKGVRPTAEAKNTGGIKLFLNKPDATGSTPERDPHFVAAVDFQPTKDQKPENFLVDLAPTIAQLLRTKQLDLTRPLQITFAVVGETREGPVEMQIPIESVKVTVPGERK
jgi:hypothetical protein